MSGILKELLSDHNPLFSHDLYELEKATGNRGIDARLIGDIQSKCISIINTLGLDPNDTTGAELYAALNATVDQGRSETLLKDAGYLIINFNDGPISFNLDDVSENKQYDIPYKRRSVIHGQNKLKKELINRYLQFSKNNNEIVYNFAKEIGVIGSDGDIVMNNENTYEKDISIGDKVLIIGDIISGFNLYVNSDQARIDIDGDGRQRLSFPYGLETPYNKGVQFYCIGSGANSAVAMARMGIDVSIMSFVGDDKAGKTSLSYLPKENINTDLIQVQKGIRSHQHYTVCYDADHITFSSYEDYTYKWQSPKYIPDYIYLTDISENSWQLHLDLINYLDKNKSVKLVFRPGKFHIECGLNRMADIYKKTEILCLNRDNACSIVSSSKEPVVKLMERIHALGPKTIVITDGINGSYVYDGNRLIKIPNYPNDYKPLDRTGAGDCFASTFISSIIYGETIESAAKLASINSMKVTQKLGPQAGLTNYRDLKNILNDAPKWYHGRVIGE